MVFKVISCNGVINPIPSAELVFCLAPVFYIESVLITNVQVITNLFLPLNVPFITAIIESRQALFRGLIFPLTQVAKIFLSFPWCFTLHGPDTRLFFENVLLNVLLCYIRRPSNHGGTWNKQDFYYWLKLKRFFPFWLEKLYFSPSGLGRGNNMEPVEQK